MNLYRLIRRVLGNETSDNEIARRWGMDRKNFNSLKHGRGAVPRLERLRALAVILSVPELVVLDVASGSEPDDAITRRSASSGDLPLPGPRPGERGVVLLVEDEEMMQIAVARMLGRKGYLVHPADTLEEALVLARRMLPGVVLLDLLMPRCDPGQLVAALRADPALASLPVIACSALAEGERIAASLSVVRFLRKPFEVGELLAAIESALRPVRAVG